MIRNILKSQFLFVATYWNEKNSLSVLKPITENFLTNTQAKIKIISENILEITFARRLQLALQFPVLDPLEPGRIDHPEKF